MLTLLSPAKTMDFDTVIPYDGYTPLLFREEAQELVGQLKLFPPDKLAKLLNISDRLAHQNAKRFLDWRYPIDNSRGRQAIFAFKGDVYTALDAYTLNPVELEKAQDEIRIISGLYGVLRPLDLILPYRLEMATKLKNKKGKDLYSFWRSKITKQINKDLTQGAHTSLINLASQEYYKAINHRDIDAKIYTPVFKEYKNGTYKVISLYAKKARGLMVQFILKNRVSNPDDLKAFDLDGYHFNNSLSGETGMIFTRH